MLRVYLTFCGNLGEHDAGVLLALHAIKTAFGVDTKLTYTERGKPLTNVDGAYVSISHSGGLCMAAVSDAEVGADLELINRSRDISRLVRIAVRFFAKDEREYVLADPSERFWEIWTAKESYIKYTGEGLVRRLNGFSVLDGYEKYLHFYHRSADGREWAVCICTTLPVTAGTTEIVPVFVDIDEISVKV